jgi:hypothetical protein
VPGPYNLREVLQPGWAATIAPTIPIDVGLNQQISDANFGNKEAPVALAGDYSGDGVVDAVDYVVWRRSMNQSVPPFSGADGNGSGIIDQDDYLVWRANFGRTASGTGSSAAASASVAEVAEVSAPSESLPLVVSPGFAEVESPVPADEDTASETVVRFSISAMDADGDAVDFSSDRPIFRPRLNAGANLNDAALMAVLATRSTNDLESAQADGASTAWSSTVDEEDASFDSLDLAFETLGGVTLRC